MTSACLVASEKHEKMGRLSQGQHVRGRKLPDLCTNMLRITMNVRAVTTFKNWKRDFPGCPAFKTLRFQCSGHGFDPWSGN